MSISSKKVVSKPIGVQEVANLLHVKTIDVGAVCCAKDKINPWSKHKPLDSSLYTELTEEQMAEVNYGLDLYQCAWGTMNGTIIGTGWDSVDRLGVGAQTWVYHSPADSSTAKYRLTDFNGYKHKGYEYRGPVRFRPVHETIFAREGMGANLVTGAHLSNHFDVSAGFKILKTYTIPPHYDTMRKWTGIHITYTESTTADIYATGTWEIYVIDANNHKVATTGTKPFVIDGGVLDYDYLFYGDHYAGFSIEEALHWGGKGPYTIYFDIDVASCAGQYPGVRIETMMSCYEYLSEWPEEPGTKDGFFMIIPDCSGDWAENDHAYEKELLHYIDPSTGNIVYTLDPVLIMKSSSGTRYWYPAGGKSDAITAYDLGMRNPVGIETVYLYYCNKAVVTRDVTSKADTYNEMNTFNSENTVIFPAPYCKWDWDAMKKS